MAQEMQFLSARPCWPYPSNMKVAAIRPGDGRRQARQRDSSPAEFAVNGNMSVSALAVEMPDGRKETNRLRAIIGLSLRVLNHVRLARVPWLRGRMVVMGLAWSLSAIIRPFMVTKSGSTRFFNCSKRGEQ